MITAIAYDARYITAEPTGIGQLCLQLLHGFASLSARPPMKVLISQDVSLPDSITTARHLELCPVPWQPHGLRNQVSLAALLRHHRIRLLHSVDAFQPVLLHGIKRIVTIHDLIPLTCAPLLRKSTKVRLLPLWKAWLRWQCAGAQAVVTVSHHSAQDIERLLHVPRHKIRVIYNPVRTWDTVAPAQDLRQQLGLHGKVISYVGRQDPYKNLVGLVRAFALVKTLYQGVVHLVLAGHANARYPALTTEVARLGLTDTVVFPGYLSNANIGALYTMSDVFVFPSLYEGFGLPPIEAMACGTPVVASNRTALPEILGDAALLVDPENDRALADSIVRVLTDAALAQQLRQAGHQRAAFFSTQRAAEQHVMLYEHVLAQS